jgi:hypothetical protein
MEVGILYKSHRLKFQLPKRFFFKNENQGYFSLFKKF